MASPMRFWSDYFISGRFFLSRWC